MTKDFPKKVETREKSLIELRLAMFAGGGRSLSEVRLSMFRVARALRVFFLAAGRLAQLMAYEH